MENKIYKQLLFSYYIAFALFFAVFFICLNVVKSYNFDFQQNLIIALQSVGIMYIMISIPFALWYFHRVVLKIKTMDENVKVKKYKNAALIRIFLIAFGILGSLSSSWFYFGAGFGAVLFIGGIIFANAVCWPKEQQYSEELRKYRTDHEEELWAVATADIRLYNEEQKKIAELWRAVHPLEEKIRACLKDPMSSVDIANLARYYAEIYLTEKN